MALNIGVVAPSSSVPQVELGLAAEALRREGFSVRIHPQCKRRFRFFAGRDEERAQAFFDSGMDASLEVLWCARGGSGALRILPLLEKMTAERGVPPKKLLIGYSDATALMEFVRQRWGWSTMHGPMMSQRQFSMLPRAEWRALVQILGGQKLPFPHGKKKLRFLGARPSQEIQGELVGGNLSIWASLLGTPFVGQGRNRILFFEDVGEPLYRLDRQVKQLELSGAFQGARAIVLGTFQNCSDAAPSVLKSLPAPGKLKSALSSPKPAQLKPLRPLMSQQKVLAETFGEVGERSGIPVALGLPVGHGPAYPPLPLGAQYVLRPSGELELRQWDWLDWTE